MRWDQTNAAEYSEKGEEGALRMRNKKQCKRVDIFHH